MKKLSAMLMICLMLFTSALAATEPFTALTLPVPLSKAFSAKEWKIYSPISYAITQSGDMASVAMRSGGKNILCILLNEGGVWRILSSSRNALYQGDRYPVFEFISRNSLTVSYGSSYYDNPADNFETYTFTLSPDNTYRMTQYTCEFATDRAVDFTCLASKRGLEYIVSSRSDDASTTFIEGTIERRLPYFNIALFPKSIGEAQLKLSNPDILPAGSALTVQEVTLSPGKKYPVYTAPYADSFRAANGKAAVSTNDWVSVFGQDGNWLLIEYDITAEQARFGYITASALPKNTNVTELIFNYKDARVNTRSTLTDDPLRSQSAIRTLYAGEFVTYLTDFGDGWAYVEYVSGSDIMRGFIKQDNISLIN